jgi:RNA polymerase sigma factor for flagellar operon FliA
LLYLEDLTGEVNGDEEFLDRYVSDSESDPFHMLENQNMRQSLIDAIGLLPEREQNIMSMYYEQEMNLKEMAEVLGITDSRVSQLHSQAIARLRLKLKNS